MLTLGKYNSSDAIEINEQDMYLFNWFNFFLYYSPEVIPNYSNFHANVQLFEI